MEAFEILERIKGLGISARVDGDRLLFEPGSQLPADLLSQIREHKTEIIAHLNKPKLVEGLSQWYAETIAAVVQKEGICIFWYELIGEMIAFIQDDTFKDKVPRCIVAYSNNELKELFGDGKPRLQARDLKLIHEAKKAGGQIISHVIKEEGEK